MRCPNCGCSFDANHKPTPREIEVLKLRASGLGLKETAAKLGLSYGTIACHWTNLRGKLGLRNMADATRYAIENGFVDSPRPDEWI